MPAVLPAKAPRGFGVPVPLKSSTAAGAVPRAAAICHCSPQTRYDVLVTAVQTVRCFLQGVSGQAVG